MEADDSFPSRDPGGRRTLTNPLRRSLEAVRHRGQSEGTR